MTLDSNSEMYINVSVSTNVVVYDGAFGVNRLFIMNSEEYGITMHFDGAYSDTAEIMMNQILNFQLEQIFNTRSISVEGDAEILGTNNATYWNILVKGDFTIKVDIHN